MPVQPFRTRSYSWPYQNIANGDREMPHIIVKIKPSMQCVSIPLRMALTWNIFTKTLNRLYNALQSDREKVSEYWPPMLNDAAFRVFREDTQVEITTEQWTRTLQPGVVFIVEFCASELPPMFLAPGLDQKSSNRGRQRPYNLQLSFLSSLKGLEKHPGSGGLSGAGSPCIRSPTLPSINELSCSPAQSVFFPPAPSFYSSSTRTTPAEPIVVDEEDINAQWDASDSPSHHMMDASDSEITYPSSTASPAATTWARDPRGYFYGLPPPSRIELDPECLDSVSEADEYDEEEEDEGSDDSRIWGDVSGGDEDNDYGMEGIEMSGGVNVYGTGTSRIRPAPMKRRQTHPLPKHRIYHSHTSHHHPTSSSKSDDLHYSAFSTTANAPHRVMRWDKAKTKTREAVQPILNPVVVPTVPDFRSTGNGKRKRGGGEDGDEKSANQVTDQNLDWGSTVEGGIAFGRETKRMRPTGDFLGFF